MKRILMRSYSHIHYTHIHYAMHSYTHVMFLFSPCLTVKTVCPSWGFPWGLHYQNPHKCQKLQIINSSKIYLFQIVYKKTCFLSLKPPAIRITIFGSHKGKQLFPLVLMCWRMQPGSDYMLLYCILGWPRANERVAILGWSGNRCYNLC